MNKKIKTINKTIKANNKKYNLQFKPTPILGGEYELDSDNGKLLENYATLNPFPNQLFFNSHINVIDKVLDEQDKQLSTLKESISNRVTRNSFGGGDTISPLFLYLHIVGRLHSVFLKYPPNVLKTAPKKKFYKKIS